MFIEKEDLKSHIYQYQMDQITELDDDIVYMACAAACDEVKSYLIPNGQGIAPSYDADAIMGAVGTDRNPLILQLTKTIAVYHLVQLCNIDILYEPAKERYDRAINYLRGLRSGDTILDLPLLPEEETEAMLPIRMGSRSKFSHE